MTPHILVVEDEPAIADTILYALTTEGFQVKWAQSGADARTMFSAERFNLIVLDVGLPDANGFELFKELREVRDVPAIFLTARSGEVDKVVGLELGADDYVTKPFSPRELAARVRSVLRRARTKEIELKPVPHPMPEPKAELSATVPFVVDESRLEIRYFGEPLELTRYEFKLLKVFIDRPGRVLSREQLLDMVWDDPLSSIDRTVDAHVKSLRAKMRAVNSKHEPIRTHRGTGYALKERWES